MRTRENRTMAEIGIFQENSDAFLFSDFREDFAVCGFQQNSDVYLISRFTQVFAVCGFQESSDAFLISPILHRFLRFVDSKKILMLS